MSRKKNLHVDLQDQPKQKHPKWSNQSKKTKTIDQLIKARRFGDLIDAMYE